LVIDPQKHDGFPFEVHDLVEDRRISFDCPSELYDMLLSIGAPCGYVIKRAVSKALDEVAAVLGQLAAGTPDGFHCRPERPKPAPVSTTATARRSAGRRATKRRVWSPTEERTARSPPQSSARIAAKGATRPFTMSSPRSPSVVSTETHANVPFANASSRSVLKDSTS
jgi:hypothetical protein